MVLLSSVFLNLSRLLTLAMGFAVGADTRRQWKQSGLMEKMQSVLVMRLLAFVQSCAACGMVAETVVWLTSRVLMQSHIYVVGETFFTVQGDEFVNAVTVFALIGWALAILLSEDNLQYLVEKTSADSLQQIFWFFNIMISLQVFLANGNIFALVSFCTLRLLAFSLISQENPGWHLVAFLALGFIYNPIRSRSHSLVYSFMENVNIFRNDK